MGRVDRAAGCLAEDQRISGRNPRSGSWRRPQLGVPASDVAVRLDAGAGQSLMPMMGQPTVAHPLHQAGDLAAEHLDRTLEHRLVVAEHADRPAVDGAVPGDHAVAEERVGVAGRLARAPISKSCRVNSAWMRGGRNALLVPAGLGLLVTRIGGQRRLLAQFGDLSAVVAGLGAAGPGSGFSSLSA